MRYAILGDIHANLTAFQAVLDDIERFGGVTKIWCLGDVVGYGPDPHECIDILRKTTNVCVAGNHDWAAIGKIDTSDFNPDAAAAAHWTARQLSPEDIEYLKSLPLVIEEGDFTLVHGSPREPVWEYILTIDVARENFAHFKTKFCLVGHTHTPFIFSLDESGNCSYIPFTADKPLNLGKNRLIINVGGVGQPRDGDPRASYAIYDSEANVINLYRIPYDIAATQARISAQKLPGWLIARLSYGM